MRCSLEKMFVRMLPATKYCSSKNEIGNAQLLIINY